MTYKGEELEAAVEALLQAGISAALDAVEAVWVATDPVTLPEPVNWDRGYRSWMLDLPSTSYPYILTIGTGQNPKGQAYRQGMQDTTSPLVISAFVVDASETTVVKIAHRYARAIVDILQASQIIGGRAQRNYEPEVRIIASNVTHKVAGESGDWENDDDVDYIRLAEIELHLEGS